MWSDGANTLLNLDVCVVRCSVKCCHRFKPGLNSGTGFPYHHINSSFRYHNLSILIRGVLYQHALYIITDGTLNASLSRMQLIQCRVFKLPYFHKPAGVQQKLRSS